MMTDQNDGRDVRKSLFFELSRIIFEIISGHQRIRGGGNVFPRCPSSSLEACHFKKISRKIHPQLGDPDKLTNRCKQLLSSMEVAGFKTRNNRLHFEVITMQDVFSLCFIVRWLLLGVEFLRRGSSYVPKIQMFWKAFR